VAPDLVDASGCGYHRDPTDHQTKPDDDLCTAHPSIGGRGGGCQPLCSLRGAGNDTIGGNNGLLLGDDGDDLPIGGSDNDATAGGSNVVVPPW
jgi:hypothetical protein